MSKFQIGDVVKFVDNSGSVYRWAEAEMTGVVISRQSGIGNIDVQCTLKDGKSVAGCFRAGRWELSEESSIVNKEPATIQDAIELVEVNEQLAEALNDLENAKNEVEFLEKRFKALASKLGINGLKAGRNVFDKAIKRMQGVKK